MTINIDTLLENTDLFDHVTELDRVAFSSSFHTIQLNEVDGGIELYVGPVDPYLGGSGITVLMDENYLYQSHITETLSACPDHDIEALE